VSYTQRIEDRAGKRGVIERFREWLPITPETPALSLGEGDTPLVRAGRLAELAGCGELYLKLEMCNPTGSFKDRGMVVAVAKAVEARAEKLLCASTGNTSASAAAYAARCGLEAFVLVPHGRIAQGKLAQAVAHGARILAVRGSFDDALQVARQVSEIHPVALVNSVNPYRIEGQKTGALEIIETLGDAPDYLSIPVGNAGNITAYWRGFVEGYQAEIATTKPKMMGWQAAGAAPIVLGHPVADPQTVASAIRIGNPASWRMAEAARDESGGGIGAVTDDEILDAYRLLAREEGIFCEPASAAGVAGLIKHSRGHDLSSARVVCIITGHGLKDPDTALSIEAETKEVDADVASVQAAMGL
jgi:threonine synthase